MLNFLNESRKTNWSYIFNPNRWLFFSELQLFRKLFEIFFSQFQLSINQLIQFLFNSADNYQKLPRLFDKDWEKCEETYRWPACCLWEEKRNHERGTTACNHIKGDVILDNDEEANVFQVRRYDNCDRFHSKCVIERVSQRNTEISCCAFKKTIVPYLFERRSTIFATRPAEKRPANLMNISSETDDKKSMKQKTHLFFCGFKVSILLFLNFDN